MLVRKLELTPMYYVSALLLLSIADAALTDIGLRFQLIEEANPLMAFVYEYSVIIFYGIKVLLPLSLLIIIKYVMNHHYIKMLIRFAFLLYAFVFCIHVLWVSVLVVQSV